MASLRKKSGCKFWYACYTNPHGQRTQCSTKTTDRKLARRIADELEQAGKNQSTEAQFRKTMSSVHEQIHGSAISSATVAVYYQQWIARKSSEVAPTTFSAYKATVSEFIAYIGEKSKQPLQFITTHDVTKWRDELATRASARTANNKLKILRVFLESAWRENLTLDRPAAKVRVLKSGMTNRRPFTLDEVKAVLSVSEGEWKGIVLVGAYTGQRLKDIASLTWEQVNLKQSVLSLVTSKTGRTQLIPLHAVLQRYLEELSADAIPHGALFPNAYKIATKSCDTSPLSKQFHAILVKAGLAKPRNYYEEAGLGRKSLRTRNPLCFHSLRHTATTWLKDTGASESVARDIIGHESAGISRLYTHTGEAAKRSAVDKLPDLLSGIRSGQEPMILLAPHARTA